MAFWRSVNVFMVCFLFFPLFHFMLFPLYIYNWDYGLLKIEIQCIYLILENLDTQEMVFR